MSYRISTLSEDLSIPIDGVVQAADELASAGYAFLPAPAQVQRTSGTITFRILGRPPTDPHRSGLLSLGAFPVKPDYYNRLTADLSEGLSEGALRLVLGIAKLAFESTGGVIEDGFTFQADDESLGALLSLMDNWDINNPVVVGDYYWIAPAPECKLIAEKLTGKSFSEHDYSWWDIIVDLGGSLTTESVEESDDWLKRSKELSQTWARYLPAQAHIALVIMYLKATLNDEPWAFTSLEQVIAFVEDTFHAASSRAEQPLSEAMGPDRELLIKELFDYNNYPYPVDAISMFDFLNRVGFIYIDQSGGTTSYALAEEVPRAAPCFLFPPQWEERLQKYLTTGSVLFSYLSLDEIVKR